MLLCLNLLDLTEEEAQHPDLRCNKGTNKLGRILVVDAPVSRDSLGAMYQRSGIRLGHDIRR